jgi:hypothetical protein
MSLRQFIEGYTEAAYFFSSANLDGDNDDRSIAHVDADPSDSVIQALENDAKEFYETNELDLYTASEFKAWDALGHDLWLTRNRHGAGYWDRTELPKDLRDRLTDAAHKAGERDLYIGDDGLIYQSGSEDLKRVIDLTDRYQFPNYAIIIRAIHERGESQAAALAELKNRGLWLAPEQRQQAGLEP